MRKFLTLCLIIPLLSFSPEENESRFWGKWIGEDNGEFGYLIFEEEGYAFFEIGDEIFGGKEFIFKGEKCNMTYVIKSGENPIHVDFIVTNIKTNEQQKLLCIANFKDVNTMEFAINFEGERPIEFNIENSIILTRFK